MPTWDELCDDPSLHDLPFKIEANRSGSVLMTRINGSRSERMTATAGKLWELLPSGRGIFSAPVQTTAGVKVADVDWFTMERLKPIRREAVYPIAPEICVEVLSRSNSREEMIDKMKLHFAAGASEVWLCGE